jgi:hypothetical protein
VTPRRSDTSSPILTRSAEPRSRRRRKLLRVDDHVDPLEMSRQLLAWPWRARLWRFGCRVEFRLDGTMSGHRRSVACEVAGTACRRTRFLAGVGRRRAIRDRRTQVREPKRSTPDQHEFALEEIPTGLGR